MSEGKVRFGIAGFGRHASKRLMPGFIASKLCTVTALSRRDLRAAEQDAKNHSIPHFFGSTEELCRSSELEAVFVASPDSVHLADVLTALEHGKHVLCEKPMAMNSGEACQMVDAAKISGKLLGVAHIFRFAPTILRARQAVASGELGAVAQAHIEFHYWNEGHGRKWINDPTLACGGPIADVGVHCIDSLRFILNDEITYVTTTAIADGGSGAMESSAIMALEFTRGVLAEVAVSTRAHYHTPLEIVGSEGVLQADDALSVDAPVRMDFRATPSGDLRHESFTNTSAFVAQADAFAAAVRGEAEFPCLGEEGLRNQLVLDAAYRSWKSGKREQVGETIIR